MEALVGMKPNPKPSDPSDNKYLKYFIAAMIMGTAISNIFVARRMKTFFKQTTPYNTTTSNKTSWNAQSTNHYETEEARLWRIAEERRYQEKIREFNYNRERAKQMKENFGFGSFPTEISKAMAKLDIKSEDMEGEKIKSKYQRLAFSFHPDTIPLNDNRKKDYEKKFQEINDAYRKLMAYVRKENGKSG